MSKISGQFQANCEISGVSGQLGALKKIVTGKNNAEAAPHEQLHKSIYMETQNIT